MVLGGKLTYFLGAGGPGGSGNKKIFEMVKIDWSSYTRWEWQEVGELNYYKSYFKMLRWKNVNCLNWDV